MADNITPISGVRRKTPKQLARALFDGTITEEDRRTMPELMRHWIALATSDNPRTSTAKRAAIKDLSELADLAHGDDGSGITHEVQIVHIKSIEENVAELG